MSEITVEMGECTCWDCGIVFTVPWKWAMAKSRRDEPVHCPNGHENSYTWNNDNSNLEAKVNTLTDENAELKRRVFQLIHDNEQAEARASEGKPVVDEPLPPDPVETASEPAAHGALIKCPECDKSYKASRPLVTHLIRVHGHDHAEAGAIAHRAWLVVFAGEGK